MLQKVGVVGGALFIIGSLWANREIITASATGAGGAPYKFSAGNTTNLDFAITATTNKWKHAPVSSITINKITLYSLRGAGTGTATAAGSSVGGFPRPMVKGVSEIEFDLTCVCTAGHLKNVTLLTWRLHNTI